MIDYECAANPNQCCAFVRPGVQPIEQAKNTTPREASEGVRDWLSKAEIKEVIVTADGTVRACYEMAVLPPFHQGVVDIQFIIDPDGTVPTAAVLRSSLGLPEVEDCIARTVKDLRFSPSPRQQIIVVTYPYVLQMQGGPIATCP